MTQLKSAASLLLVLTLGTVSTGCHTMRPVSTVGLPKATRPFAKIEIGDLVAVEMQDGSRHRFEVKAIEGDALVASSGRTYHHSEMVKLEHETVDAAKTSGLMAGIVAGYAVVWKILSSIEFFDN